MAPYELADALTGQRTLAEQGGSYYGRWSSDIDDRRIGDLVALDVSEIRKSRLVNLLERISRAPLCCDYLRICPECIKYGYHSIYFQNQSPRTVPRPSRSIDLALRSLPFETSLLWNLFGFATHAVLLHRMRHGDFERQDAYC